MDSTTGISLGSICEGCLSVDRKLTPIYGEESKTYHCILESPDHGNQNIQLCWECIALLRRMMRFQEQVKSARDFLVSYMVHQTTLTCLSQLKTIENDITQHIICKSEDCNEEVSKVQCKEIKYSVNKREKKRNVQNNVQDEDPKSITVVPITYVKREEVNDDDDEAIDDVTERSDDLDFKTELKSDKTEAPLKRTRKRKTKESFVDSDDEPLKKKADVKVKKEKVKLDRKPRPTREKAAGVVKNDRVDKMLKQLNVKEGQIEMVLLTWEQVEEERSQSLKNPNFTRHSHRCYDCVLGFNLRVKLDDHMTRHDPANGTITCTVCKVRCKDAHALASHRRRHRVRWRCTLCGLMSSRAAVAADHLSRSHAATPPTHVCSVCGVVLTTLGKLRYHMKSHSEKQNCELCGKSFKDKSALRTHLFTHRAEKEHACNQCDKKFLFKKNLEVHLMTHDAPQLLYCHQCDVNFKNSMSFYQHMRYNLKHIDPAKLKHACEICGRKFAKSSRLEEHHIAVHLKNTPIKCTQADCNFSCSSRSVLRTHIRMIHREARRIRNHVCHTCGKSYTTKKTLEGHMRSHTGERPLLCGSCPATFGYEAALYNHNRLVHLRQPTRTRATKTAPAPWLSTETPQAEMPAVTVTVTEDVE